MTKVLGLGAREQVTKVLGLDPGNRVGACLAVQMLPTAGGLFCNELWLEGGLFREGRVPSVWPVKANIEDTCARLYKPFVYGARWSCCNKEPHSPHPPNAPATPPTTPFSPFHQIQKQVHSPKQATRRSIQGGGRRKPQPHPQHPHPNPTLHKHSTPCTQNLLPNPPPALTLTSHSSMHPE